MAVWVGYWKVPPKNSTQKQVLTAPARADLDPRCKLALAAGAYLPFVHLAHEHWPPRQAHLLRELVTYPIVVKLGAVVLHVLESAAL